MIKRFFSSHFFLVSIVLVAALWVRLYKLDTPLGDWHSWRQTDTASVTREFVKHNYPIWEPHYHDLSNIPNGYDNPQGYRMVEFPLTNYLTAQLITAFDLDLIITSRLVTIFVSLITIVFLYSLIWQLTQKKTSALGGIFFFAFLPFSVFYSRVILPEPQLVMLQVVSLATFVYWIKAYQTDHSTVYAWLNFLMAWFSLSLAFLIKPTAIFIAPVLAVLSCYYLSTKIFKTKPLYLFIFTLAPLLVWRHWIANFPEGIPAYTWLLNGNGIRLRPAWWRWLFADRLGRLILGYWGSFFFVAGFLIELKKKLSAYDWLTISWAVSSFSYLVIFATGNVQHDYYQIPLIPVVAILMARGMEFCLNFAKTQPHKLLLYPLFGLCLSLSFYLAWYEVKGYYNINNPNMVAAGQVIDRITPSDSRIIAPYQGDTAFLFQTNRTGWPIGGGIEQKIADGADYYVSLNFDDETHKLMENYPVVEQTPDYIIIQLKK